MTKILTLALATLLLVTTEASRDPPDQGPRMYNDLGNGVFEL